ncbi:CCA tRNA nucleotidyltransferase [Corynebacterium uropygiale]|uniref:CCA tRNA nucleotidyltransferase n=1 Tax=Corynebacterium uropygiale TaxID=1775911 RepID=A0A9X1TYT0_9CORY|nr:CCA tRNA nucleotidyltransferase [Corynebacterium uropygiale]MCF4007640.1 CCA tRNA nucleotidyltransferase [Corynebacterium uropygiale]
MESIALLARGQRAVEELVPVIGPLVADFAEAGERLYLVGGSVRDALLGRLGNDLDFTTSARPETIQRILEKHSPAVWDTGIEFGTVSAEYRGQQIEITTFRSDSYDGQSRNPEVRFGDTLEGDLIRRDFRVNAMAVELLWENDEVMFIFHDPLQGLADAEERVLDTPDSPEISFHDDPLRMLRAARFVSQLGFRLAPRVMAAMKDMAAEIDRISAERIRAELDKLMLGAAPWTGINVLVATGLAQRIYPEISAMKLAQDEHRQHKDVYAHSLQVLRQAMDQEEEPDLVLRWAALLHDCGKPDTRAFGENGQVTFHHHEVVGAKLVRRRMRKLKYSKQMIADVSQLIYLHMRFHGFGDGQWTDSAVRRYVADAGELLPRLHKLVRADCTTRNKRKAQRLQRTYDRLEERIAEIAAKEDLARVRPDLDGNEIMEILGLPPGPAVGQAWAYLKELRLERGPLDREDAIAELRRWWEEKEGDARV